MSRQRYDIGDRVRVRHIEGGTRIQRVYAKTPDEFMALAGYPLPGDPAAALALLTDTLAQMPPAPSHASQVRGGR